MRRALVWSLVLAAGVVLGIIALNAKSFVPGFALHWLASIGFDLLVVANRPHLSA